MFEGIILGIIQGVAEWLPISSEGLIALAKINIFQETGLENILRFALFLHLGTFFAALVYLRKEVFKILKAVFKYKEAEEEEKALLKFLAISTLVTGIVGLWLFGFVDNFIISGRVITAGIGFLLLATGFLQWAVKLTAEKSVKELNVFDGILLGIVQGFAVLPGLSRSGITVAALLLRKFNDTDALKTSFLMSLPVVFFGNIFFSIKNFSFFAETLWGLVFSFIFGLLTIHYLLKISRKINFGFFVLLFGLMMIAAAWI